MWRKKSDKHNSRTKSGDPTTGGKRNTEVMNDVARERGKTRSVYQGTLLGKEQSAVSTTQGGGGGFRTRKAGHVCHLSNSTYLLSIYYVQVPVLA